MNILVLGCGMQGKAVLFDLSKSPDVEEVICADVNPGNLGAFRDYLNMNKIKMIRLDVSEKGELISLMEKGIDVAIDVLPPQSMQTIFEAALEARIHLVNTNYGYAFRHLHNEAVKRGVSIMPECGLDPGIDLVIYGHGVKEFDEIHVLNSYCGGLPEKKACNNPLNYKISWNWDAVLKSQKREAVFLKDGKKVIISAEDQHDNEMICEIDFPGLGKLEAFPNGNALFFTDQLGITKTLKETGRYSLRWPGWCSFWRPLKKFHFLSDEPLAGLPCEVTPHQFMAKLLEPQMQYDDEEKDLAVMRNVFIGLKGGKKKRLVNDLLIERDLKTGLLAMSLGVGYTASIVAQMIGKGDIDRRGILSPTMDISYEPFMAGLRERGIQVHETVEVEK